MSLRETVQIALLLAAGTVLRMMIPAYGAGMKPDFALALLFIIIIMKPQLRTALLAGVVAGILAAMTTSFPAGQIPNIIDKTLTSMVVLGIVRLLMLVRVHRSLLCLVTGALGTAFSGAVFLTAALLITGLPAPFSLLYTTVVLPAVAINAAVTLVLYPIVVFSQSAVERRASAITGGK
ncbi:MAG: tryptophan transporter [Bacillota bacterium]